MEPVMELRYYLGVFRKRFWIIVLIAAMAAGGVVYALANQPPRYAAEVSLLVKPQILTPTAFDDSGLSAFRSDYRLTVLNNIRYLVTSRAVLERVANRLGTNVGSLAKQVTIKDIRGTDFLLVGATDIVPARAAEIANTATREFVNFHTEINRAEATSTRKFIESQLTLARNRLVGAERELLEFRTRTGAVALDREVASVVDRALGLQAAYEAALLEEKIARTRVDAIQSRLRSQNDTRLTSISIATNPIIARMRDHLMGLELELAGLRQVYTDQHPRVQAMLGRIADARQMLQAEAARVVQDQSLGVSPIREQFVREMFAGEVDAAAARARAAGISRTLQGVQARLASIPKNELALARLQRNARVAEELFIRLSSLHQEALIRESRAGSAGQASITIVDLAAVPSVPVSNGLPQRAGFATLLGLFVGAGLALVLESLDDRIRSSRQAEGAFGVPVLAAIPTMSPQSYRILTGAAGAGSIVAPLLIFLLVLAAGIGLYIAQAGAQPEGVIRFGQFLAQALQTVR